MPEHDTVPQPGEEAPSSLLLASSTFAAENLIKITSLYSMPCQGSAYTSSNSIALILSRCKGMLQSFKAKPAYPVPVTDRMPAKFPIKCPTIQSMAVGLLATSLEASPAELCLVHHLAAVRPGMFLFVK